MMKTTAKKLLRILSNIGHQLGGHSRLYGPPRGVCSSHELAQRDRSKARIQPISAPSQIVRLLPNTLESLIHPQFYRDLQRDTPCCYTVELEHGRTVGSQGVILSDDDYIVGDVSRVIGENPYAFHELYQFYLSRIARIEGKVGVVAGNGGHGYFHWLYDIFPKLYLLSQNRSHWDRLIVGHYETRFVRESLDCYGVQPEKILQATQYTHYEADTLLVSSLPGNTGNPPSWVIDFLQDVVQKKSDTFATGNSKIYVSRKDASYRHVINELAVEQLLCGHGFQTVTLSAKALSQQANIFKNADVIVAPHGAGLSNIAFCKPGSVLIELFSPQYVNVCYWSISNLLSMQYWYLVGGNETAIASNNAEYRQSFSVNLDKLAAIIKNVLH